MMNSSCKQMGHATFTSVLIVLATSTPLAEASTSTGGHVRQWLITR